MSPRSILGRYRRVNAIVAILVGGSCLPSLSCGPASNTGDGTVAPARRIDRRVLLRDRLSAELFLLTLDSVDGPVQVAMFVSRGLAKVRQKEIALGVRLRAGEEPANFYGEIGDLYVRFYELAEAGQTVDHGGRTILGPASKPLLARPEFRAIVYTEPDSTTRAVLGTNGLLAIVITSKEIEVADQVGHTRLLSRLGRRARFFPTPPWSDRDRPEVLTDEYLSRSLLANLPKIHASGSVAWIKISPQRRPVPGPLGMPDFESDFDSVRVELNLSASSMAPLRMALETLPDSAPLAVFTDVNSDLPRCLTWEPGQAGGQAISDFGRSEDLRCAGNFVLFVPGEERNQARVVEDGFAVLLRTEDWQGIRDAISTGRTVRVSDSAGYPILTVTPELR